MDLESLRAARMEAQLLHRPEGRAVRDIVGHLLAVQAQDFRNVTLALQARSPHLTHADLLHAYNQERSVIRCWLQRGTIQLVRSDDYHLLHSLTSPVNVKTGIARMAMNGVTEKAANRLVSLLESILRSHGPQPRSALRSLIEAEGVDPKNNAIVHVLFYAVAQGVAVMGPVEGKQHLFAATEQWLGPRPNLDRQEALGRLVSRYLESHGPATEKDIARWAALPLRDVRAGLAQRADDLRRTDDGLMDVADRPPAPPIPLRLIPAFDEYVLGYSDRSFVLTTRAAERAISPGNGYFRAAVLCNGIAEGSWSWKVDKGRLVFAVESFGHLTPGLARAIDQQAADIARYLGVEPPHPPR